MVFVHSVDVGRIRNGGFGRNSDRREAPGDGLDAANKCIYCINLATGTRLREHAPETDGWGACFPGRNAGAGYKAGTPWAGVCIKRNNV
jgi:hypothetical protein